MALFRALLLLSLLVLLVFAQKNTSPRKNRMLDDRVNKMDEATKRQVLAMQNAGMPREAIAKKIAYAAGGEGTARRMVDRINVQESKKYLSAKKTQQAKHQATMKAAKNDARRRAAKR